MTSKTRMLELVKAFGAAGVEAALAGVAPKVAS
jgi:hypothetical protein